MRLLFCSIVCLVLITASKLVTADRPRRYLAFRKGSSFFYRLNYKINMFPYTAIFAQVAGFKVVWQLPSGAGRSSRSIHEVHDAAELVYDSHDFDGKSCVLKNICQAMEYVRERDGVMAKILKLLVGSYANNNILSEDSLHCDVHVKNCPLQLIGIDSFMKQ